MVCVVNQIKCSEMKNPVLFFVILQAIRDGYLYALRYPMCDDLPTVRPDLTDFDPRRKMRDFLSPIVLLVSAPDSSAGGLKPLAIQIDHTPGETINHSSYTMKDQSTLSIFKL